MVDLWVMVAEADDAELVLERWRAGRASDLDLYLVVSDAMDQAARRGLWRVLREAPQPHDVQTAVVDAFRELWATDPAMIDRLVSFAATIADRRGRDRGRAIIRENKKIRELTDKLGGQLELDGLDDQAAAARAEFMTAARGCLADLTDEQRDVLDYTYAQGGTLSDWAHARGKSHQAAVQQRQRAEAAVRRCVARKRAGDRSSDADQPKKERHKHRPTGRLRDPRGDASDSPGTLDNNHTDNQHDHHSRDREDRKEGTHE